MIYKESYEYILLMYGNVAIELEKKLDDLLGNILNHNLNSMVKDTKTLKKNKKNNQGEGGGRPPKMTEGILKKLLDCFSVGTSDEEACMYADISPVTLYAYQKKNPKFLKQKEYLKTHSMRLQAKLNIRQSVMDYKNVSDSWKRLEKKDPEFKEKLQIDGTITNQLSDEDKEIYNKILQKNLKIGNKQMKS